MKTKKLAIIGGGIAAVPILQASKQMGVETHCFALAVNPQSEGLYDFHHRIDYLDIDTLLNKCKEIGVHGIIATSENTTASVAQLTKLLGLPGNRFDGQFTAGNKYLQRQAAKEAVYFKQPQYGYFGEVELSLPLMVKTTESSGKKGVRYAGTEQEYTKAIEELRSEFPDGKILIEQVLAGGVEYSIECLSYKGTHQIIQVTQKDSSGPPYFVELGHHQPGKMDTEARKKLDLAIPEILDLTGVQNSLSHVEVKVIEGEIYFIELGARAGGDRIADTLLTLSNDCKYFNAAVEIALGDFSFGTYKTHSYSGIYFLCAQTAYLTPLFDYAEGQEWCRELSVPDSKLQVKYGNDDGGASGYLIYQSDHKISLRDVPFEAVRINDREDALELMLDFSHKIKRDLPEDELINGLKRFIEHGNVVAVLYNNEIIGMMNMYCRFQETKDAYPTNLDVLDEYQGYGLSNLIWEKSIDIVRENGFLSITLHVAKDNARAINLYRKFHFLFTGEEVLTDGVIFLEMKRVL